MLGQLLQMGISPLDLDSQSGLLNGGPLYCCEGTSMEILGVTFAKVSHRYWIQLRDRPKYWWSLVYAMGEGPWICRCRYGWTYHVGEGRWKTHRSIWMGPVELSRDEK